MNRVDGDRGQKQGTGARKSTKPTLWCCLFHSGKDFEIAALDSSTKTRTYVKQTGEKVPSVAFSS